MVSIMVNGIRALWMPEAWPMNPSLKAYLIKGLALMPLWLIVLPA